MSIGRLTCCAVVIGAAIAYGRTALAQDTNVVLEEKTPLVVSGFAVGLGTYDRNLAQNTALGSKIALSLSVPGRISSISSVNSRPISSKPIAVRHRRRSRSTTSSSTGRRRTCRR